VSRILIVEDEPSIAEMLQLAFEMVDSEVRCASNGKLALAVLDQFTPDLILTDYMMPVMDGCEFVEVIRRSATLRHVRVIVMTAVPEAAARHCHQETILAKPVDIEMLLHIAGEITPTA
jgi:two-component system, OmpR family, response regulator VicR